MNKIKLYTKAIVEVNDNGDIFLSAVPWHFFFIERICSFLGLVDYGGPYSVRLVFPWELKIEE